MQFKSLVTAAAALSMVVATSAMAAATSNAPKPVAADVKAAHDMNDSSDIHGASWLVSLLALTAVITGAVIATNNKNHTPTSP